MDIAVLVAGVFILIIGMFENAPITIGFGIGLIVTGMILSCFNKED